MKRLAEIVGAEDFAAIEAFVRRKYGDERDVYLRADLATLLDDWPVNGTRLQVYRYPIGDDWVLRVKVGYEGNLIRVWSSNGGWL